MKQYDALWELSVKVSALDVIQEYVSQGYGIGFGVQVPGRKLDPKVRAIPIPECPDMKLGVMYQGKLKPLGEAFLGHAEVVSEMPMQSLWLFNTKKSFFIVFLRV